MMALDMDKLRKVRALMGGGKTAGERAAARARAEAIARRAGLSLTVALSKLDAPDRPQPPNIFAGFDDWMEEREPGYKARKAVERAQREATRLARCRDLLAVYGSEDAVFAPSPVEAALRDALAHLEDPENTLWGYRDYKAGKPTPEMWSAIRGAVHVPETVPEAWEAYQARERLVDDRCAFVPDYSPEPWGDVWRTVLERLLDTLNTPTAEGIAARIEWQEFLANREWQRNVEDDKALIAALRADFATFAASVQSGRVQPPLGDERPRRTADRAAAVRAMLATSPGLSDREIARRVGCSPQTVGNWRRRGAA